MADCWMRVVSRRELAAMASRVLSTESEDLAWRARRGEDGQAALTDQRAVIQPSPVIVDLPEFVPDFTRQFEISMNTFLKLAAACLSLIVLGLFATGIERIVWVYSGSGLLGVVPKRLYLAVPEIQCDRPSIEVKRDSDGVLRYRCGDYWLFAREARSQALTGLWPHLKQEIDAR